MDEFGGNPRPASPYFGEIDQFQFVQQVDNLQELNLGDPKQGTKITCQLAKISLELAHFLWRQVTDVRRFEVVELAQGGSRRVIGEDSLWIP